MVEKILARLVAFPSVVGTPKAPNTEWIICGRGDIARGYRGDKYITRAEFDECLAMILTPGERLCA
jgi:hypothetical protein